MLDDLTVKPQLDRAGAPVNDVVGLVACDMKWRMPRLDRDGSAGRGDLMTSI